MTTPAQLADILRDSLGDDAVALPGSDAYRDATTPDNASVAQAPGVVVRPADTEQAARALAAIADADSARRVAVQATGHGAGRPLEADDVLVDSGRLTDVRIDAAARRATVGAGATWGSVQAAAQPAGLLGRAGTSAGVAVCGYTFAGGLGWLTRPHGLAAAGLEAVRYLDGAGRARLAAADAPDALDREALWAFRGGAPVGIATELTFSLVPAGDLAAGYLLWPAEHADGLLGAWAAALRDLAPTVTSTIALLAVPPEGPFPDELLGTTVVHLACASPAGVRDLGPLRETMTSVAAPAIDTTGPCDAERLATIHLDPPAAVPARGLGRWLAEVDGAQALAILRAARTGETGGANMVELRHVAGAPAGPEGAMTAPPAPILLHAVGDGSDADAIARTDALLDEVLAAAAPVDAGLDAPSFAEGRTSPGVPHDPETLRRLQAVARALDPDGRLRFERGLPDQ